MAQEHSDFVEPDDHRQGRAQVLHTAAPAPATGLALVINADCGEAAGRAVPGGGQAFAVGAG